MMDVQRQSREQFIEEIADALAERLGGQQHKCIFDDSDIEEIRRLCGTLRDCRRAGTWGVVSIVIGSAIGILVLGFRAWVQKPGE